MFFVGSYTDTLGLRIIREDVAKYISKRDGYPADPDDVLLINGGATGIQVELSIVVTDLNSQSQKVVVE